MNAGIECAGLFGEKGCGFITSYEIDIRQPIRKKAWEWFRRPPYQVRRGDASGQENTGRVYIHERGNKGSKETDFKG
ncbi:MAG: hypothetical protein IJZ53_07515 [Tyzzerella sp.]|nr:hypothetical protein [Tyzzerella sp.]